MRLSYLLVAIALGCSSGSSSTSSFTAASTEPPPGCSSTVCDLERAACTPERCSDPCRDCRDDCETIDIDFALECMSACNRICAGSTPKCTNSCDDALVACRKTTVNAVCTDGVDLTPATGEPPCGGALIGALCACHGAGCESRLYALAPACVACQEQLLLPCVEEVCAPELAVLREAYTRTGCTTSKCMREKEPELQSAFDRCFAKAASDPADRARCRSGALACFGPEPLCEWEKKLIAE